MRYPIWLSSLCNRTNDFFVVGHQDRTLAVSTVNHDRLRPESVLRNWKKHPKRRSRAGALSVNKLLCRVQYPARKTGRGL